MHPRPEWQNIRHETDVPAQLFTQFLLPMAGVAAAVVFALGLFRYDAPHALLYAITHFVSISAGTWLTFLMVREVLDGKVEQYERTALHLSVYSTAVFLLFQSVSVALVSGFVSQLFSIACLLFLRTLHAGISGISRLTPGQKTSLLIIAGLSIICIPAICKRGLMILFHIPVLNL